jgi:hypothetical protein
MLVMFTVFAVLFFMDAKTGYRQKNLAFYTRMAFDSAFKAFPEYGKDAESWAAFTKHSTIPAPAFSDGHQPGPLPEGVSFPLPWPEQLKDYEKVKAAVGNWRPLYDEYRTSAGIQREPDEHDYPQQKITEQWAVFGVSSVLALATLFVLIRTKRRTLAVDDTTLYPPAGAAVPISDLSRLDLRKWDTKGVAFAWAKNPGGEPRKIRLDGFVYGGFKKDQGEPAEAFMKRLKASFSGEIMQYVTDEAASPEVSTPGA